MVVFWYALGRQTCLLYRLGVTCFVFVSTLRGSTCVEFVSNRYRNRSRKPSRGEVVFVGCVVVVVVVVCGVWCGTYVSQHTRRRANQVIRPISQQREHVVPSTRRHPSKVELGMARRVEKWQRSFMRQRATP